MFGMGFTEILIIAVIAILFLGPDKLPGAMVDIAKFFRNAKNAIGSVKDSLEQEMNVSEIKQEALAYKKQLLEASEKLEKSANVQGMMDSHINDIINDTDDKEEIKEEVTFKKEKNKDV
jgi:sec-independent protein translocase protein TatB